MKRLAPLLCIALTGCLRHFFQEPVVVEEDPSIVFPSFFAQPPIALEASGTTYVVDGTALRTLSIAAQDFLPREDAQTPCRDRRASHTYRILRQGDVLFIRIDPTPAACGQRQGTLDAGAKYAIHRDGRILRRVVDGREPYADAGAVSTPMPGEPGVSPSFDPQHPAPLPFIPGQAVDPRPHP